jgi:group I intron endonuclease
MISCIYTIKNTINGKQYIGSTKDFEKRKSQHLHSLRNNNHINIYLQRSFNKYGELAFLFDIIELVDVSELYAREDHYIKTLNTQNETIGYNLSGVGGGDTISNHPNNKEIRNKISKSMKHRWEIISDIDKAEWIRKHTGSCNGMYGKRHSNDSIAIIREKLIGIPLRDETKHKMKLAFTETRRNALRESAKLRVGELNTFYGKTHSQETKQIISQKNKNRNYIPPNKKPFEINGIKYDSLYDASTKLSISPSVIRWRILSKNKKYDSYYYIN